MLPFLPPDVAVRSLAKSAPARIAPASDASDYGYDEALAEIAGYARALAALPPPSEKKDDVGYSGATDAPMRDYLDYIAAYGADALPARAHFKAASMLLVHGKTQLPGDRIRALREVIRQRIQEEGRAVPPEKGKDAYALTDARSGGVKHQGTYAWERAGSLTGEPNHLYIWLSPDVKKQGIRVGNLLEDAGLQRGVHYQWFTDHRGDYPRSYLMVPASHIKKVLTVLHGVLPELSAEILENIGVYRKMAGLEGEEAPLPPVRRAEAFIERPASERAASPSPQPAPQPALDPKQGGFALPKPNARDFFSRGMDFRWDWDPNEPETVTLAIPAVWANKPDPSVPAQMAKLPLHALALIRADVPTNRTPDYRALVLVQNIPALAKALLTVPGDIYASAVDALRQLYPVWRAKAAAEVEQRVASVTVDEQRLATRLARRYKHIVAEGITEAQLRDALIHSIDLLRRIQTGDLSVDAGIHGSWFVHAEKERVKQKDKLDKIVIREYVGFRVPFNQGGSQLRALGSKAVKEGREWVNWIPMKKVSAAARALDPVNPVLAMTLRLALLTDADIKVCHELDSLAQSFLVDEIPDPKVSEQVRRLEAQANLKARRIDAEGRTVEMRPFEYQSIGMAYAWFAGGRALIGDSMGLGKTIQAIGYAKLNKKAWPILVICPSNAAFVWKREFERWLPGTDATVIEEGSESLPRLTEHAVVIMTYAMFRNRIEELLRRPFQLLIFDESHNLKHPESQQSQAAARMAAHVPYLLLLSGTSMENRIPELWHQLYMISPESFPSFKAFAKKYASKNKRVIAIRDMRGDPEVMALLDEARDENGAVVREFDEDREKVSMDELTDALRCFMVRRKKQDVLHDLPDKRRRILDLRNLDLSAYRLAEKEMPILLSRLEKRQRARAVAELKLSQPGHHAWRELMARLNDQPFDNPSKYILTELNRLRELVGEAKVGAALSWIQEFLKKTGRPLLVFAEHREVISALSKGLKELGIENRTVTGSTSTRLKSEAVDDFQDGKYPVLIASQTLREAVTLTRARDVLFIEWWWVPARMEQAEDRVYRIGQTGDVTIYIMSAPGTIDDDLKTMITEKRELVEEVIGADEYEEESEKREVAEDDEAAAAVGRELLARWFGRVREAAQTTVEIDEDDVRQAERELADEIASRGEVRGKRRKK